MINEELIDSSKIIETILATAGKGAFNVLKFKHKTLYAYIVDNFEGRSNGEKIYRFIHRDNLKDKCTQCPKKGRFLSIKEGYSDFCSKKCYEKVHGLRIKAAMKRGCYDESLRIKRANKKIKIKKVPNPWLGSIKYKQYLVDRNITNISQLQEVKDKNKQSIFKRLYNDLINGGRLQGKVIPLFESSEYKGQHEVYKFQCCKCNFIFEDRILNGKIPRCTNCYPLYAIRSFGQKELFEFIKTLTDEIVIWNDKQICKGVELDIYIPSKKLAFEYNGLYWHSEISNGKAKNYHLNKYNKCKLQGIQLIQIFEDEWLNKQEIVKHRIKHMLGKADKVLYARKCELREISSSEKNEFLEMLHLQGKDNSNIKIGAYHDKELVAVMTFGALRKALGSTKQQGIYELYRFACKYAIAGIASKLLQYFIKQYSPTKIITYADKRWSQGNLYKTIGFTQISEGVPNYWYLDLNHALRLHRFGFRKSELQKKLKIFNPALTEWENMQVNKYDRIWDCGSLKFEMTF